MRQIIMLYYENNVRVDTSKLSVSENIALMDAFIQFLHEVDNVCSENDNHMTTFTFKYCEFRPFFVSPDKTYISKINIIDFLNKRIIIKPKNTLCHVWKHPVELIFV